MQRYIGLTALLLLMALPGQQPAAAADKAANASGEASDRIQKDGHRTRALRQGMAIEMSVRPAEGDPAGSRVLEGEYAELKIKIRDAATDAPVRSMYPAVWVDQRKEFKGDKYKQELTCTEKIRSYLKGGLSYRPDIDLNSYYILSLNNDATISVIDPIVGVAGFSQMFKMILLRSPGADWTMGRDEKTLLVTMPRAGQVALVNLEHFTVKDNLPSGENPTRIVLQPDNRFLWVTNDAPGVSGGVTVLDAERGTLKASIPTAPGRHDIALSDDSLFAFVANRDAGTVSVIDTQTLQKLQDVATGSQPSSIVYSSMSKSVYVVDELDGTITVIDGKTMKIVQVIRGEQGISTIRFAPGNRWGFVLNRRTDNVLILDSSTNAVAYRERVGRDPEQVTFSPAFAYVRSRGTAEVTMLALDSIGKGDKVTVLHVSGGSRAPSESTYYPSAANSIATTPEGNSVVIASPSDATIIYYMEGMGVPMGSFKNSGRIPRALKTLNRSLSETEPGIYSARIKVPRSGVYDVVFLLDSPRITECFSFPAEENPALAKMKIERPVRIEFLMQDRTVESGHAVAVRVKLVDELSGTPVVSRRDFSALPTLTPSGNWQERHMLKETGDGHYEFSFTPPEPGTYTVYFALTGMKLGFSQLPFLSIKAVEK
jgi:YVTN family beta-propeller protein